MLGYSHTVLCGLFLSCSPKLADTGENIDSPRDTSEIDDSGEVSDSGDTGDTGGENGSRELFVAFGYPAVAEMVAVQMVLTVLGALSEDGGITWNLEVSGVTWTVHIENTEENLVRGLSTPHSVVVYGGHSNYGLGPYFSDLPVDSSIPEVRSISDFFNMGTEYVAINETWLRESQAYPNFRISEQEIVPSPTNYLIEGLGEERFPNDQGVPPGGTFTLQEAGGVKYHYTEDGSYRLVVVGGAADLPDTLAYDTLFLKSCHSGRYFWEVFDRGKLFYTRDNVEVESEDLLPTADLFVKGMILGWEEDEIVEEMNTREDIYAWADRG